MPMKKLTMSDLLVNVAIFVWHPLFTNADPQLMTAMPKYVDSLRKPEDQLLAIFVRLNVELIISKMSAQTFQPIASTWTSPERTYRLLTPTSRA
jgi:hypothetical protein